MLRLLCKLNSQCLKLVLHIHNLFQLMQHFDTPSLLDFLHQFFNILVFQRLGTSLHTPEEPPQPSERLLLHSLFQSLQKLFLHQQVF
nr:hypothetical protein Iba_chr08aCG1280 [Ipomoea batatas]GMD24445.1 hypothetical protein Iba_chr08cCG0740 [Ipomoea batatas]GME04288.1 hypothetical protein Iba_scaffold1866CG0130 [Ipomoea batatas]